MEQLQLGKPAVHTTYYGRNVDQMPKLLASGKEPMSIAHLMEQRIAVRERGIPQVQHDAWWNNYFDTADLWLRHPDKGGKVVPYDAQVLNFLREHVKPDERLVDGAVPLPNGLFEAMEGLDLTPADIERLNSRGYAPREAKNSGVWKELARTQERLDTYVDAVAPRAGGDQNMMNLCFGKASEVPTGRLWYIDYWYNDSLANGSNNLTNAYGRLVGVAPKLHAGKLRT